MYIDIVPNRKSPPAILLREAHREGGKVKKVTIANLSGLPMEQVPALRRILKGETLVGLDDVFEVERSLPHGHVEAVIGTTKKRAPSAKLQSTKKNHHEARIFSKLFVRLCVIPRHVPV